MSRFKWTPDREEKLKILFDRGKTRTQIASEFGCKPATNKGRLKKLGLRRYKASEVKRIRPLIHDPEKENFPDMPAVINFDIYAYRFGKWAVDESI